MPAFGVLLGRAVGELSRLAGGLGSRHYGTAEMVTTRISAIARELTG